MVRTEKISNVLFDIYDQDTYNRKIGKNKRPINFKNSGTFQYTISLFD